MLSLDAPARRFRPAETRDRFTAFVHGEVDRLVGAVAPRGHAEVRADLAGPLAVAVVTEALGLRNVTPTTIRSWYDAFVEAVSAITAGRPANAGDAYDRLRAKVEEALDGNAAEDALLPA